MRSMYGLGCVSCSPCRPVRQACKAQGENSQDACACMRSGTELTLLQHRASERGSIRDCRHQLWDRQGHEGLSRQTLILISRQICVGPALMAEISVAMCRDMPRPHTMVPSSSRPPTKAGSELHQYTAGPKNTTPPPSKRLRNDPVTNPDNEEGPNLAGKAGCYTGSISAPPNLCKKTAVWSNACNRCARFERHSRPANACKRCARTHWHCFLAPPLTLADLMSDILRKTWRLVDWGSEYLFKQLPATVL